MMRRPHRAAFLLAASLLVVACGPAGPSAGAAVVGPSDAPGALTVIALDIAFEPAALSAPAGVPLAITFDNQDAGIPHNVRLLGDAGFSTTLVESEIVTGPATQLVAIPGLVPGRYRFDCTIHPNMTAELTVGG
jgi:plastocyanin